MPLNKINSFVFQMDTDSVLCEVRTEFFNVTFIKDRHQRVKWELGGFIKDRHQRVNWELGEGSFFSFTFMS
jgi:hypothetical protein